MDENYRIPRTNLIEFIQRYNGDFKSSMSLNFDHIEFTSGNISFFELVALTTIIYQFLPDNIMEFGTFNGRTTLNFALNSLANIITVDLPPDKVIRTKFPMADGVHDPNNELGFVGLKKKLFDGYEKCPIAPITQLWMDTAAISISSFKNQFDFMFIDASHSYENCLNDSFTAHEIVKDGGIIAWHDYNGWPGVTKAINEFSVIHHWIDFHWLHDTSIVVAQNIKQTVVSAE